MIHSPIARSLALPLAGRNGVEAPVDEHAESGLAPPVETGIGRRRGGRLGRVPGGRPRHRPGRRGRQDAGDGEEAENESVRGVAVWGVGHGSGVSGLEGRLLHYTDHFAEERPNDGFLLLVLEQESVVAVVARNLAVGGGRPHRRGGSAAPLPQLVRRVEPVGRERHEQELRPRCARRRRAAYRARGQVEVVERLRQVQQRVGVEALDEALPLVVEVALHLELHDEVVP